MSNNDKIKKLIKKVKDKYKNITWLPIDRVFRERYGKKKGAFVIDGIRPELDKSFSEEVCYMINGISGNQDYIVITHITKKEFDGNIEFTKGDKRELFRENIAAKKNYFEIKQNFFTSYFFRVTDKEENEKMKDFLTKLNKRSSSDNLVKEINNKDLKEENSDYKKNILPSVNTILYGPPGTGKTYNSIKYAVDTVDTNFKPDGRKYYPAYIKKFNELKEVGRIAFTTFHQSYGYEEFIEGIKPNLSNSSAEKNSEGNKPNLSNSSAEKNSEGNKPNLSDNSEKKISYKIAEGVFKKCCEEARGKSGNYVFIIDEINRGNISKIFGELITLIEDSKREGEPEAMSVILPYSEENFSVPKNVYILGTMNTADRSISLMDTALRRRFEFVEMMPDEDLLDKVVVEEDINIYEMLKIMNRRIEALYDREHTLGHAFFMPLKTDGKATINQLESIFKNKIIPLLQEYFYEDYEKIMLVLGIDPKNTNDSKFISVKSNDGLFKNSPEIGLNTTYQINNKAFEIPENYRNIYGSISNSGEANEA